MRDGATGFATAPHRLWSSAQGAASRTYARCRPLLKASKIQQFRALQFRLDFSDFTDAMMGPHGIPNIPSRVAKLLPLVNSMGLLSPTDRGEHILSAAGFRECDIIDLLIMGYQLSLHMSTRSPTPAGHPSLTHHLARLKISIFQFQYDIQSKSVRLPTKKRRYIRAKILDLVLLTEVGCIYQFDTTQSTDTTHLVGYNYRLLELPFPQIFHVFKK